VSAQLPGAATQFEFATAGRIVFGPGTVSQVPVLASGFGKRALLVNGRSARAVQPLADALATAGVTCVTFAVGGEPTTGLVEEGVRVAREGGCDLVIGFGGGSAIDTAKAVAALLTNPGNLNDYLEIIGRGMSLTVRAAPLIAVPTTAGTGSEVTRNAVLASPEHRVKVSLRGALMLPRVAVIDPQLTYELPKRETANTGLDALTQVIEPFVSVKANPMTDGVCREGMVRAARSLQRAFEHGDDTAARLDMCVTSLFGGLALANAGLGAAHGFAGPIGGAFDAPHGALCAAVLPCVMEVNVRALQRRAPASEALGRYGEVARLLTGRADATPRDGVAWVADLCLALDVPPLRTYGLTPADLPEQADRAAESSSMKGNPIELTREEMLEILERSF
jgi:alcohol dehydrogenase class IV